MTKMELSVDVTRRCIFRCSFCSSSCSTNETLDVSTARAIRAFACQFGRARDLQIQIAITGGEPLLLDTLPDYLGVWRDVADNQVLCTTCAVPRPPEYWHALFKNGLRVVRLSVLATSDNACSSIFGREYTLRVVLDNIALLRCAGVALHVNYVLYKRSHPYAKEVIEFISGKGVEKFRVLGLAKQGRAAANWSTLALQPDLEAQTAEQIIAYCREVSLPVEFAGVNGFRCSHADSEEHCLGGSRFFHINPNGDIYPCPSLKSYPQHVVDSVCRDTTQVFNNCTSLRGHNWLCKLIQRTVYSDYESGLHQKAELEGPSGKSGSYVE